MSYILLYLCLFLLSYSIICFFLLFCSGSIFKSGVSVFEFPNMHGLDWFLWLPSNYVLASSLLTFLSTKSLLVSSYSWTTTNLEISILALPRAFLHYFRDKQTIVIFYYVKISTAVNSWVSFSSHLLSLLTCLSIFSLFFSNLIPVLL